jgi:hypothetical protein
VSFLLITITPFQELEASPEQAPFGYRVVLQDDSVSPQSFVSGPWRATVVGAFQSPAIEGVATTEGIDWAVLVMDLANWTQEPAAFNLSDIALAPADSSSDTATPAVAVADVNLRAGPGTDSVILGAVVEGTTVILLGEPENGFFPVEVDGQEGWIFGDFLSIGGGVASAPGVAVADLPASQAAASILDLGDSTEVLIQPSEVERIVAAIPTLAGVEEYAITLGGEDLPIPLRQREALSPSALPAITQFPVLVEPDSVVATNGRTLSIKVNDETKDVQLVGIDVPTVDECFASESEAALADLVSNGVRLEAVGDEFLVWTNNNSGEAPTLVNRLLVENGFAGVDGSDSTSGFSSWLQDAQQAAVSNNIGLWEACTGVHGEIKPEPTPTPVPTQTPAEQRASYPVLPDVRELAIRPGNLMGDKVAFTGEIFTIQVATPGDVFLLGDSDLVTGSAAMQIWVTAPDGTREAVFVAYDGDTAGMFEGTWVTVYGTVAGTQSGTNLMGGEISQPLVEADIIDFA